MLPILAKASVFFKTRKLMVVIALAVFAIVSGQFAFIWKQSKDIEVLSAEATSMEQTVQLYRREVSSLHRDISDLENRYNHIARVHNITHKQIQKLQKELQNNHEDVAKALSQIQEVKHEHTEFFDTYVPDSVLLLLGNDGVQPEE